ncbi:hypothetical protein PGB90_005906 [Kerria lacca]
MKKLKKILQTVQNNRSIKMEKVVGIIFQIIATKYTPLQIFHHSSTYTRFVPKVTPPNFSKIEKSCYKNALSREVNI